MTNGGKFVSFKCMELGKRFANSIASKRGLTMNFVHFFQLPDGQSTHFQSVVHPDGRSHQFQTQTVHDVGNVIAARDERNQVGNMLSCCALTALTHIVCTRISLRVPLPAQRRLRNFQLDRNRKGDGSSSDSKISHLVECFFSLSYCVSTLAACFVGRGAGV